MSAPAPGATEQLGRMDRILNRIEWLGNKLPQPFNLFVILFLVTGVVSTAMALADVSVAVPGADDPVVIRGLFTGEGLTWLTTNIGENFLGFPPLVTVLPIMLAIGIAEYTGFLGAGIRAAIGSAPQWLLPYMVGFIGVIGSIMSDSAFVVIPPLAALAFKATGRHPVAGLLGGFAAAGAGYSTNIFPTSLDALFAGITNSVLPTVPAIEQNAAAVNPVSNWFFNIVCAVILGVVAGFLIDRILEPQMNRLSVPREETSRGEFDDEEDSATGPKGGGAEGQDNALTSDEKKGLRWGFLGILAALVMMAIVFVVPGSPWRNEEGGYLPDSPLLDSIVFIVMVVFAVGGYFYGWRAGTIQGWRDVPHLMGLAMKDMIPFIVLAFILGNFIALFNWSGIGSWIAVTGANGLETIGLTGFPAIIGFAIVCSILNLFIISGSGMWSIMAAVFVPLFGLLGYEPAFVQAAFRVGDSATQILTPMNPYMIVLLGFLRRYEPKAGLGTVIARMLPFTVVFWIVWMLVLFVFFQFEIPLGPGNDIYIQEIAEG